MIETGAGNALSSQQAAVVLGVSVATLTRWAEHGDVPSFQAPDGKRCFSRERLEEFAASLPTRPATRPGATGGLSR